MTCPYCCESLGMKGTAFSGSAPLPEGPADLRRGTDLYTKMSVCKSQGRRSGRGKEWGQGGKNGDPPLPPTCLWMPHLESETQEEPGEPMVAGRGEARLVMLGRLVGLL